MMTVFSDIVANLLTFRTIDKCLLETLYDLFHVLKERLFRAVVIDEVLNNVAREFVNTGVYGVSFVDDLPLKNDSTLFIHLVNLTFTILFPVHDGATSSDNQQASTERNDQAPTLHR